MKVMIAAVGRAKSGPEAELVATYLKRLPWEASVIEVEEKRALPPDQLREQEGALLLAQIDRALGGKALIVALDSRGKTLSSEDLAARLSDWQQDGPSGIAFVIGGANGLSGEVMERAELRLSLGPMTWPHLLARAMLAEQLYRAWSIGAGHPYHLGH